VDPARISASDTNGVLELTIPKVEQAKPRKIEIKAA
jgi:HSP20 family molecular chaperone IbpA